MSMSINPAGQSWQQPPVPRHDDLPQKLMQERGDYREEIASLSSTDDEESQAQLKEDYQKLSKVESKLAQISTQPKPSAVGAYQKVQTPPPTDEEMNRRFGSAYSVEISSLQSGKTLTSAIPELETHSHL